jgi:hypothetical protein
VNGTPIERPGQSNKIVAPLVWNMLWTGHLTENLEVRLAEGGSPSCARITDKPEVNFSIADNSLSAVNLNLCVRLAVGDVKSCTQRNGTRIEACQEENP